MRCYSSLWWRIWVTWHSLRSLRSLSIKSSSSTRSASPFPRVTKVWCFRRREFRGVFLCRCRHLPKGKWNFSTRMMPRRSQSSGIATFGKRWVGLGSQLGACSTQHLLPGLARCHSLTTSSVKSKTRCSVLNVERGKFSFCRVQHSPSKFLYKNLFSRM